MTITGTGLGQVAEVIFGGGGPATILDQSGRQVTVQVPRGKRPGRVDVTLIGFDGLRVATLTYTYERPGTGGSTDEGQQGEDDRIEVTGAAPSSGPMAGGTEVIISGRRLDGITAVRFGDTPAVISSQSSNQLTVISPAAPTDFAVNIVLEHAKGGIEAGRFQYLR